MRRDLIADRSYSAETIVLGAASLAVGVGILVVPGGDLVLGGGIAAAGGVVLLAATVLGRIGIEKLTWLAQRIAIGTGVLFFLGPFGNRFGPPSPMRPTLGAAMLVVGGVVLVFRQIAFE